VAAVLSLQLTPSIRLMSGSMILGILQRKMLERHAGVHRTGSSDCGVAS
jgi:hypothetical protein